jgi:hypothetical protein
MGTFSGMKNAKRGFASNPLKGPGRYMVRIDECAWFETKDSSGADVEYWKTSITILGVEEGDHTVGEVCAIMYKYGGKVNKDTFQSNVKGFICDVTGLPPEQVGEDETLQCLEADGPLNGLVTIVKASIRLSKKSKNDKGDPAEFTVYSFSKALKQEEIIEVFGNDAEKMLKKYFPNGLPDDLP